MDTLSITTVRPALEITSRRAKINISNKRPAFRIKRTQPYMYVNKKAPTFKVNWLNVRSGIGLTPIVQLTRQFADEAKQKAMQAIGKIVENGDLLMHVEGNTNPIAAIARERSTSAVPDLNIGLIPPQDNDLEWDLGYFKVEWSQHATEIEWIVETRPEIRVEPYSVEVRIRNHPEVRIRVNKSAVRNAVGSKVDKMI